MDISTNFCINTSFNDEQWEVENILNERISNEGIIEYQIKWKNYNDPTWEPMENINNCKDKLKEYFKKNPPLVFVKDMQKQLPLPTLQPTPPEMFRARKTHINNYGIYDCQHKKMNCYLWSEYVAETKGDDICSCLWKQLQPFLNQNKHIIQWSDNCVTQNCSWKVLFFHLI